MTLSHRHVRVELLQGDFGENIKLLQVVHAFCPRSLLMCPLQSFPESSCAGPTDMNILLKQTHEMRASLGDIGEDDGEFAGIPAQSNKHSASSASESVSAASSWAKQKAKSLWGYFQTSNSSDN